MSPSRSQSASPRLTIITGVVGRNEVTTRWLETTIENCVSLPDVVIISNGSTHDEYNELDMAVEEYAYNFEYFTMPFHPAPLGTTKAFNWGLDLAETEIVAVIQNDFMIYEPGWDQKLLDFFERTPDAGVVGLAGAKQFAADDIYRTPYQLQQLGRAYMYTSFLDWQPHGNQTTDVTEVACLDGVFIAFRPDTGLRFDERYHHHMYDSDISIEAHYKGLRNFVLPIPCDHISGQSANYPVYQKSVEHLGGDAGVHSKSHELMYDKWRDKLPVRVG
jgi:GT2 family glycosyltransferase